MLTVAVAASISRAEIGKATLNWIRPEALALSSDLPTECFLGSEGKWAAPRSPLRNSGGQPHSATFSLPLFRSCVFRFVGNVVTVTRPFDSCFRMIGTNVSRRVFFPHAAESLTREKSAATVFPIFSPSDVVESRTEL